MRIIPSLFALTAGIPIVAGARRLQKEECHDPLTDPTLVNGLTLHDRRQVGFTDYLQQYKGFHKGWVGRFYKTKLEAGSLLPESELIQTVPSRSPSDTFHFVYWNYDHDRTSFQASAFSSTSSTPNADYLHVEGSYATAMNEIRIQYVPPNLQKLQPILANPQENIQTLHYAEGDYVAFLSIFFDEYQHLVIDHLGYLAFLRKTQPPTTRFLLVDVADNGLQQELLQTLDPDFARRVDWLHCPKSIRDCHRMVEIRGGAKLKVVTPQSPARHADLLRMAREWIQSSPLYTTTTPPQAPLPNLRGLQQPQPVDSYQHWVEQREVGANATAVANNVEQPVTKKEYIIYYTRHAASAGHGRAIEASQEAKMLDMIQHYMARFHRTEELVVFDGSLSIPEQIQLFRSANVVIGPHGGGLANILFLPTKPCHRPQVLEFVTSLETPLVQNMGSLVSNYYTIFSTCPWVEYHQLLYVPPSNKQTTFVDMDAFQDALLDILGGVSDEHAIVALP